MKKTYATKSIAMSDAAPKQKRPTSKSKGKYKNASRYGNLKNFYLKGGFEDE